MTLRTPPLNQNLFPDEEGNATVQTEAAKSAPIYVGHFHTVTLVVEVLKTDPGQEVSAALKILGGALTKEAPARASDILPLAPDFSAAATFENPWTTISSTLTKEQEAVDGDIGYAIDSADGDLLGEGVLFIDANVSGIDFISLDLSGLTNASIRARVICYQQ